MQTAFVSLFYIFINMKPWNAWNSSVVVVGLLPTRAFNEFLYEFLRIFFNFGNFVKIREFFAEVTNSRSMESPTLPVNYYSDVVRGYVFSTDEQRIENHRK